MNECSIVQDLLPLYADDAVSGESGKYVREHLRACPACRAYFARSRRVSHAYREPVNGGPESETRLLRALRRRTLLEYAVGAGLAAVLLACAAAAISDALGKE